MKTVEGGPLLMLAVVAQSLSAQAPSRWRPEERVVVADFSRIDAVAVGRAAVFGATPNGLVIYDRRFGRWNPPVTAWDGYPAARALSALVDPADESLWLATRTGLLHYRPELRDVEELVVPGGVSDLAFDREDPVRGVYLRQAAGWQFLGRGQRIPQPASDLPPHQRRISAPSLAAVLQRFPMAEPMGVSVLADRARRRYRYTAAAAAPEGSEVFFGTDGLGLVRLDAASARLDRLTFGLRGSRVGAVAPAADGVWAGVEDLPGGGGLVRVSPDLSAFEEEQDAAYPLGRLRDVATHGGVVWAATDYGLLRVEPGSRWRVVEGPGGLPGPGATVLAPTGAGLWVGSDRGLFLAQEDESVAQVGPGGIPILALLPAHDSVWVGTARGLVLAERQTEAWLTAPGAAEEPLLHGPVVALARSSQVVVAATPDRILWKPEGASWIVERVLRAELGTIVALAADSGGVWIGGAAGIAFFRFEGRSTLGFRAPEDVPGPVRDLAVSGPYLWVGTDRGLVRFLRRSLVP